MPPNFLRNHNHHKLVKLNNLQIQQQNQPQEGCHASLMNLHPPQPSQKPQLADLRNAGNLLVSSKVVLSEDEMARFYALQKKAEGGIVEVYSRPLNWILNNYVDRQAYYLFTTEFQNLSQEEAIKLYGEEVTFVIHRGQKSNRIRRSEQ